MANYSWIGTGTADWITVADWNTAANTHVPGAGDNVTLGGSTAYTVTVNAEAEAAATAYISNTLAILDIDGTGSSLTLSSTLTNKGTLDVGSTGTAGASLTDTAGTLYNQGTANIGSTSQTAATTVTLNGLNNSYSLSDLALLGASGHTTTVTVSGTASNAHTVDIGGFSTLSATTFSQSAGTTTVDGTLSATTFSQSAGTTTVDSGGTLSATTFSQSAGTTTVGGTLTASTLNVNGGTVDISSGTLSGLSSGTLSGTYVVRGKLDLPTDVTTLSGSLTLSGAASVVQSTSTPDKLETTLGSITGTGSLSVIGGRVYDATHALTVASGGTLAIGTGSTLSTTQALTVQSGGTLTDSGTLGVTTTSGVITFAAPTTLAGALTIGAGSSVTTAGVLSVAGKVTDAGTITNSASGNVLTLTAGTARLVLDPTFSILSDVNPGVAAGTGSNVLELAKGTGALGTLTEFGTDFTGFGTVVVDGGADWTIDATAASLTASQTIAGAGGSDILNVDTTGAVNLTKVSGFSTITLAGNDVTAPDAAISGKTITGTGTNTLVLTTVGGLFLQNISAFSTITLATGNTSVGIGKNTLSGGALTIHDGASGNNTISAVGDTGAANGVIYDVGAMSSDTFSGGVEADTINAAAGSSTSGTLTFHAGSGTATLNGGTGAQKDIVTVSAALVGGDTLTGSTGGSNKLTLTTAGTFSLAGVSNFGTILLASGNNTVTAATVVTGEALTGGAGTNVLNVTNTGSVDLSNVSKIGTINLAAAGAALRTVAVSTTTLTGTTALKPLTINDAGSGDSNAITVTGGSGTQYLTYNATISGDSFSGGLENDTVVVSLANLSSDTLSGGGGSDTIALTTAGTFSLTTPTPGFTVQLAAGSNAVTVDATAFNGGVLTLKDGASGNNLIDTSGSTTGDTLTFVAGSGSDYFVGGAETDLVTVGALAVATDTLIGSGVAGDVLTMANAGSFNLNGVSHFATIKLATGNNVVVVTSGTLIGGTVTLADGLTSGNNNITVKGVIGESFSYTSVGSASSDTFTLGGESDTINGSSLTSAHFITVHAGSGLQTLTGGAGNDVFYAGGDTTMTGNGGTNQFRFDSTSVASANNVIADTSMPTSNELVFSNAGFALKQTAGTTPTAMNPNLLGNLGTGAFTTSAQRFAYVQSTGTLLYDAGGSSTPSSTQVVATLSHDPSLAAGNFFIVS